MHNEIKDYLDEIARTAGAHNEVKFQDLLVSHAENIAFLYVLLICNGFNNCDFVSLFTNDAFY